MIRAKYTKTAFSLVELLIIMVILSVIAAMVIPEFQYNSLQTKESAAKANLKILREAMGRYAAEHNDTAPGYPSNDLTVNPNALNFLRQLVGEGYISKMPANPFNDLTTITILTDAASFPDSANGNTGWICKPATKTIKLNWTGTDSSGVAYWDY